MKKLMKKINRSNSLELFLLCPCSCTGTHVDRIEVKEWNVEDDIP